MNEVDKSCILNNGSEEEETGEKWKRSAHSSKNEQTQNTISQQKLSDGHRWSKVMANKQACGRTNRRPLRIQAK